MSSTIQHNECLICYDTIINQITLPCCKKSFCTPCLEGWKPRVENYIKGERTCPNCRALVPPTGEVLQTIQFYKKVSLSLSILMQDSNVDLPVPPFPDGVRLLGNKRDMRHFYETMQTAYAHRVRLFEQKYGEDSPTIIPSTPPVPIHLPVDVIQAVRDNVFLKVRKFLSPLPIPPRRLNAICPESGNTLLHFTVQANNLEMVKVLLALGADVNATNFDRLTSLFYAVKIEGSDDRVAKALIRSGAKKVSKIFPTSFAKPGPDYLLAGTAQGLGKSELALILKSKFLGRHCKFKADGVAKRGTIVKDDIFINSQILLDNTKQTVLAITDKVEICNPLLFDFRDIDHTALIPNLPPNYDPPGRHHLSLQFDTEDGVGLRLLFVLGGDPPTSAERNGLERPQSPLRTMVRTGIPDNLLQTNDFFERFFEERASGSQVATGDLADALTMLVRQARNGNLSPQGPN